MQRSVILASGSPRRKELLKEICKDFVVITSEFDEMVFPRESPDALVKRLSIGKAEDVWDCTKGDRIVIGADTVVALDGEIMGKPAAEKIVRENSSGIYRGSGFMGQRKGFLCKCVPGGILPAV